MSEKREAGSGKRNKPVLTLVLTGGFGSGKSEALKSFKRLGAATFDCDQIARGITSGGESEVLKGLRRLFGVKILNHHGALERTKLAAIVFRSSARRRALERLLHPLILKELAAQLRRQTLPAIRVVEMPLYFEAMAKNGILSHNIAGTRGILFDASMTAHAREDIIIKRSAQGLWGAQEIKRRLRAQMPLGIKCCKSDFILDNNGSRGGLHKQVERIFRACATIIKDFRRSKNARQ